MAELPPDPDVRGELGIRQRRLERMEKDLRTLSAGQVPVWNGTGWDGLTPALAKAEGAFAAWRSTAVSYTSPSEVVFNSEEFDVSGWYDTANGRYTPQKAGYVQLAASLATQAGQIADQGYLEVRFYKNGSLYWQGHRGAISGTANVPIVGSVSPPIACNGSSDYFTISIGHTRGSAAALSISGSLNWFGGRYIGTA